MHYFLIATMIETADITVQQIVEQIVESVRYRAAR